MEITCDLCVPSLAASALSLAGEEEAEEEEERRQAEGGSPAAHAAVAYGECNLVQVLAFLIV